MPPIAGGVATGLLGFVLHFAMALIMAAVYYVAATRIPLLVKRAVWCGPIYGLGLYLTMNYIVLPLSALGRAWRYRPALQRHPGDSRAHVPGRADDRAVHAPGVAHRLTASAAAFYSRRNVATSTSRYEGRVGSNGITGVTP